MKGDWKRVTVADMDELAKKMVAAANLYGANIDEFKINTLKNLCMGYLEKYSKKKCPR